jgi:hypothetical protein
MTSRRAALLHSQLSALARQCEVAHTRWTIAAAGSAAWQAPAQLHTVQQRALQIAAGNLAVQRCSWTAGRGYAADAAQVADVNEGAVALEFTEAAVEVRLVACAIERATPQMRLIACHSLHATGPVLCCCCCGRCLCIMCLAHGTSPRRPPAHRWGRRTQAETPDAQAQEAAGLVIKPAHHEHPMFHCRGLGNWQRTRRGSPWCFG